MERTSELQELILASFPALDSDGSRDTSMRLSGTPCSLSARSGLGRALLPYKAQALDQAHSIDTQITNMESLIASSKATYLDYHRYLRPEKTQGSADGENIVKFETEVSMFLATCTTDAQILKRVFESNLSLNESHLKHCTLVVNYLMDRLFELTKQFQNMKEERKLYAINPFNLFDTSISYQSKSSHSQTDVPSTAQSKKVDTMKVVSPDFADRYTSEIIGKVSQEKKLTEIAKKHKSRFMKESEYLSSKFSREIEEAHRMEQNVVVVTEMIGRFAQILSSQSDQVVEMHDSSASATSLVKQTEEELLLTVKRSETSQTTMTALILGLALLLLAVDFLTP